MFMHRPGKIITLFEKTSKTRFVGT